MKTWRDYGGNSGTATITWRYNRYRGWLDSKEYPDSTGPAHTYGSASRLASVSQPSTFNPEAPSAEYSYLENSALIGQIGFKQGGALRMTMPRSYDNLNRLTLIRSLNAQSVVLDSHSYTYNNANQRTRVTKMDSSRWDFGYDALGQVTSGKRYWSDSVPVVGQQFEYAFDDIGNRKLTAAGGDEWGGNLRRAWYTANELNQYTSRTVPGVVDVVGTATNTATVTANDTPTYRHGTYYAAALALTNTGGPIYAPLTNLAVLNTSTNDLITNVVGSVFLPQTPEQFEYDYDGNLTNDGRWIYTWDAENRLVSMVAKSGVAQPQRLDFAYDSQSRRVTKKVWNNTAGTGTPVADLKFVYDGWNLVAELNATNNVLIRSYMWGLDLSGTLQGAGGVGGLLAIRDAASASTHFPAFDGNGNVSALFSAASASSTAQYEFGP